MLMDRETNTQTDTKDNTLLPYPAGITTNYRYTKNKTLRSGTNQNLNTTMSKNGMN